MSMTRNVPQRISAWRLGVVDAAGPLILYLVLMVMQYFVASPRFFRAVSPDPFSRDNLIAVNVAAMTGVLLVVLAWLSAGDHPWGARLSGASRLTIACSSYVGTLAVITMSSVQWAIIALQPSSSPLGDGIYPSGVSSWLVIVFAWLACDGCGRLIGCVPRHASGLGGRALGYVVALPVGLVGIAGPVAWLVVTANHRAMHTSGIPATFWLLGLVTIVVIAAGSVLTATGRLHCVRHPRYR
ncbi:MAG: hypothetical protein E7E22_09355 [Actinomyces sp.]|nr:hypothetical protein [Actinomyces sp.]